MSIENINSGWEQYSNLVLKQLENLSDGINALRDDLASVKEQLVELKAKEDRLQELKAWKDKVDEIASPRQMSYALKDIEELKTFKTKAVTVFVVVQSIVGGIIAAGQFL